jgi:hypothetical protein
MGPDRVGAGRKEVERLLERIMEAGSTVLEGILSGIDVPLAEDDFLIRELERILSEGEPRANDDFRFLIEQGLRLEWDGNQSLRARVAASLRLAVRNGLRGPERRAATHLAGAIEDLDFPLSRISTFGTEYSKRLFDRLELSPGPGETAASLVDVICEEENDAETSALAVASLGQLALGVDAQDPDRGVAIRALAYLISEPILEEALEEQAMSLLGSSWPAPRNYMLYGLRRHTHEDLPYRWIELLIELEEPRAVDRILEEVLIHARDSAFRQDLLGLLDLTARSRDPGRRGKCLRLLEGPGAPREARELLESWLADSEHAGFLRSEPLPDLPDFVHLGEDFPAFVARQPGRPLAETLRRWEQAYHESLGWQRWSELPRSDLEIRCERDIRERLLERLSPGALPEEGLLRGLVESLREEVLETGPADNVPLVTICRERSGQDVWMDEVYRREVHALYRSAAEAYDDGDPERARRKLDLVLGLEPDNPFARALDQVMRPDQKSLQDLK